MDTLLPDDDGAAGESEEGELDSAAPLAGAGHARLFAESTSLQELCEYNGITQNQFVSRAHALKRLEIFQHAQV